MENIKVGNIIYKLRLEKGLTQKQLADKMNLSDKTISKWERGLGCPDISYVSKLSDILGVNIESLLNGELPANDFVGGNMKKSKFFICPDCGNISFCTGNPEICCCGRKLYAQTAKKAIDEEKLNIETIDNEWFVSSEHSMTKDHYITFIAFVTGQRLEIIKQYPEWNLQVRLPKKGSGLLIWHCNKHGLFYQLI